MKVFLTAALEQAAQNTYLPRFEQLARRDRAGQHTLTATPHDADIILFVDAHQHPADWRLKSITDHPLARRYREKTLVYNELDQPWCALPGLYVSMPRMAFNARRQRACCYIQNINPYVEEIAVMESEPDLLFSFMGRNCYPAREEILKFSHSRALIEDTSRLHFFGGAGGEIEIQKFRYVEIMRRSKFVLCPRGVGPASFRLFETLAAGRVPVIISDQWVAPRGPDWNACALRVPEAQVAQAPAIIEAHEKHFDAMARAAQEAWREYFSADVLFHRMMESCREILEARRLPESFARHAPDLRALRLQLRHAKARLIQRNSDKRDSDKRNS